MVMKTRLLITLLTAILLIPIAKTLAEETSEDSEIVDLEKLVVHPADNIPGAELLTIDDLPTGLPGNLAEELAELPGISMNQRGAFSGEPMIRGMGFDRVATSLNGLPLPNGSPTRTHAPITQFGGILQQSVQLSRFLPSVTLGPPATAGRIDLVNESSSSQHPYTSTTATCLQSDYFPGREGLQLSGLHSMDAPSFGYAISAYRNSFGNYDSGDGREIPSRNEDLGAAFSASGKWGKHSVHRFDTVYRKQLFTENASLPLDVEDGEFLALTASHKFFSDDAESSAFAIRYGYSESDAFLSNERRDTRPILITADTETQTFHIDARWIGNIAGMGSIEAGVDANQEKRLAIRQRGTVATDYLWPDIRYQQAGLFLETNSPLSEKLDLRAGLRWDYAESEARDADKTTFGHEIRSLFQHYSGEAAGGEKQNDNTFSGNLLLHYKANERSSFYAGLGSSAQVPQATERYRTFLNALGGGFEIGNPALSPERKWELVGGGSFLSRYFSLRFDAYYYEIQDYIWRQNVGNTMGILPPLNPLQVVYSFRNVDAHFTGAEIEGVFHVGPHFQIPVSLEWVDARLDESGPGYETGDRIPELPPMEIRVSGVWNGKIGSMGATAEWSTRWTASQDNKLPGSDPTYTDSDSYWIHDLLMTLKITEQLTVKAGIRNIFDEYYTPYLTPPVSSIRPSSGDLNPGDRVPGAGREAVISLKLEF